MNNHLDSISNLCKDFDNFSRILDCLELIDKSPFIRNQGELFQASKNRKLIGQGKNIKSIQDLAEEPITAKHFWQYLDNRDIHKVADASIHYFCSKIYGCEYTHGDGELSWPKTEETELSPPEVNDFSLIPLSKYNNVWVDNLIRWTMLYSKLAVFVIPLGISSLDISYSGRLGDRSSWPEIDIILACNKYYDTMVKKRKCIFLPFSNTHSVTSTWDYGIWKYKAPYFQKTQDNIYPPINNNLIHDPYSSFVCYHEIILPYFKNINFNDLILIAEKETDAFTKFNYYLSQRLKRINNIINYNELKDVLAEIDYQVANLNIEFEKLKKLKIIQKCQIAMFTLGLVMIFFVDMEAIKQTAGILGSVSLWDLIKEYISYKNKNISLKKNDFYLPFLIKQKHK